MQRPNMCAAMLCKLNWSKAESSRTSDLLDISCFQPERMLLGSLHASLHQAAVSRVPSDSIGNSSFTAELLLDCACFSASYM
jgi:hypothetical protein